MTGNLVEDNESDCGITVVSHNGSAVSSAGKPQPTKGGTFDNTISYNTVISNGYTPVTVAAFSWLRVSRVVARNHNKVIGNEIVGNGLSGVTIDEHFALCRCLWRRHHRQLDRDQRHLR